MSGALAARGADRESEKGRVEKTRVARYRAGVAPEWAQEQEEAPVSLERVRTEVAAPVIVKRTDDPRLRRLAGVSRADREEAVAQHRQIRAAEIVRRRVPSEGASSSDEEEDAANGHAASAGRAASSEPDTHRSHRKSGKQPDNSGSKARGRVAASSSEEDADSNDAMDLDEDEGGGGDGPVRRAGGRHRRESSGEPAAAENAEEEEMLRRRQAVKERLLALQRAEDASRAASHAQQAQAEEESEEEEESSSEYETDSDDDAPGGGRMLKPLFIPRAARDTVAERDALDEADARLAAQDKARKHERKGETKAILAETLALEAALAAQAALGPALGADEVDTDDDDGAVEAYEEWKVRELRRMQRDRSEREVRDAEARERERLKHMSEEERAAWEKANPKAGKGGDKSKWKFMQKYWHKGAFFQENPDDQFGTAGTDQIFSRDYSAPTGEDLFDKSTMPKIMQVKNFGRSGRTKYTHLLDQDTTQAAGEHDLYTQVKDKLKRRTDAPASAEEFARPTKFKR